MADRFYCPGPWAGGVAVLDGDEARHLAKVRRVGLGESVALFDGAGRAGVATVVEIGRDRVVLQVVAETDDDRKLSIPLVLATAVPKRDRFDWLVEKATELGVTRLIPLVTARSVVDPRTTKLDRLRRLVVEASKQSGRATLMTIDGPRAFADWLRDRTIESRYIAQPTGHRLIACPDPWLATGIGLTIGPEGGFTDAELAQAETAGLRTIGLGPTILRVETAAVAACVAVLTICDANERGNTE